MATSTKLSLRAPQIDLSGLKSQFTGLQGRHPGYWPILPRMLLLLGLVSLLQVAAYFVHWQAQLEDLDQRKREEQTLRDEYVDKIKQAVNLDALRKQKELVAANVADLEKQLPSKAEMDALLNEISQAGLSRGWEFDLFRPGSVSARENYAELPIEIQIVGNYHDLGAFASDLSNLPRIVTLHNLNIQGQEKGDKLTMNAVVKTYRYLDPEEVAAQREAAAKGDKK
jgi:type IV pilus assembly protein PilO